MKKRMKKWLRPALFTLGGGLVGLGYYCVITSNPFSSMTYMALVGFLLSGALGSCCGGSCKR